MHKQQSVYCTNTKKVTNPSENAGRFKPETLAFDKIKVFEAKSFNMSTAIFISLPNSIKIPQFQRQIYLLKPPSLFVSHFTGYQFV